MESRNVTSPSSTPSHPLRAGPVSTSSVPLSHWRSYSCVSAPPERIPETIPDTPIIRNGTVRFKGYGFVTSWVWLRKSLALTKETLSVHKREVSLRNQDPQHRDPPGHSSMAFSSYRTAVRPRSSTSKT